MFEWVTSDTDRPWKRWALLGFALFMAFTLALKWNAIGELMLIDTDDNLRMAQVRDWLAGQRWSDLRQYRMEPPGGIDVHWSRIPDLPIAGLILLLTPLIGGQQAEQWAAALAPFVPASILFLSITYVVRRVAAKGAWPIAMIAVLMGVGLGNNLMPMRIDHHGWQLAMLALAMAGFVDAKAGRGGAIMGLAIVVSLAIGLEMIIFLALLGVATVAGWIFFRGERSRLLTLGATTAGLLGPAYLLFASDANRGAVCDALSTVWLSDGLVGGALLILIAWKAPRDWRWRLALAAGAGVALVMFHAFNAPDCLQRLEGISSDAQRLWLSRVTEAQPAHEQSLQFMIKALCLPIVGLVGYALLFARSRDHHRRIALTLGLAALAAFLLMFWQARMSGAAQLLAIPGSTALLVIMLPRLQASASAVARVLGTSLLFLLATNAFPILVATYLPLDEEARDEADEPSIARDACKTREALATLASLPAGHVYTFLDMAPRLLVMTPHTTVTGPYHRNDDAIVANIRTLRATPDVARARFEASGADYLYLCKAQMNAIGKDGIAGALVDGETFDWLERVDQPGRAGEISLLYRIVPGKTG